MKTKATLIISIGFIIVASLLFFYSNNNINSENINKSIDTPISEQGINSEETQQIKSSNGGASNAAQETAPNNITIVVSNNGQSSNIEPEKQK